MDNEEFISLDEYAARVWARWLNYAEQRESTWLHRIQADNARRHPTDIIDSRITELVNTLRDHAVASLENAATVDSFCTKWAVIVAKYEKREYDDFIGW